VSLDTGSSTGEYTSRSSGPSWNYRKEDGGGIIVDMLCHWRYVIDNLFGDVQGRVFCNRPPSTSRSAGTKTGKSPTPAPPTTRPTRTSNSTGGVVCPVQLVLVHVRVRRDDLLHHPGRRHQGLGRRGACATAGCSTTPMTPKPVWNPDIDSPIDFFDGAGARSPTQRFPATTPSRSSGSCSSSTSSDDGPFPVEPDGGRERACSLPSSVSESWKERRWLNVTPLS
jgi:hypothetical protein